jgi:hypothetical protein
MGDIPVRFVVEHSANCYAAKNTLKGLWATPWAFFTGNVFYRDKIGRKSSGSYYRWVEAKCNCTTCPALILVQEKAILQMLPNAKPWRQNSTGAN